MRSPRRREPAAITARAWRLSARCSRRVDQSVRRVRARDEVRGAERGAVSNAWAQHGYIGRCRFCPVPVAGCAATARAGPADSQCADRGTRNGSRAANGLRRESHAAKLSTVRGDRRAVRHRPLAARHLARDWRRHQPAGCRLVDARTQHASDADFGERRPGTGSGAII